MKRFDRLLAMALALSARRRLRAEDLAGEFRISLRTVYRDLKALVEAGFPLEGTPGDGYVVVGSAQLRPLSLTSEEAEALLLATRLFERGSDEAVRARLQSAVAKLEAAIGADAVRRLKTTRRKVVFVAPWGEQERTIPLAPLLAAINDRQVLTIEYDGIARGSRTARVVEPLGLVRFTDRWHLAAYCRLREDLRVFRADRIASLAPTGEHYEDRPNLGFEDFVARARDEAESHARARR
ncbi:MAG: helix-turn-helix transcriptional regulator [Polyangiales bacterium]